MADNQSKPLKLNYKAASIATDGNAIASRDGTTVELLFFQIRGEEEESLQADVVASIRMNNAELKQLYESLGEHLETAAKTKKVE